jgi:hypothetical protein
VQGVETVFDAWCLVEGMTDNKKRKDKKVKGKSGRKGRK